MRACGHFQSPKMKARYDLLIHFDHGGLFDVVTFIDHLNFQGSLRSPSIQGKSKGAQQF